MSSSPSKDQSSKDQSLKDQSSKTQSSKDNAQQSLSKSSSPVQKVKSMFKPSGTQHLAGSDEEFTKDAERATKKQQRKEDYERLGLDEQVKGVDFGRRSSSGTGKGKGESSNTSGGSGSPGGGGVIRQCH